MAWRPVKPRSEGPRLMATVARCEHQPLQVAARGRCTEHEQNDCSITQLQTRGVFALRTRRGCGPTTRKTVVLR